MLVVDFGGREACPKCPGITLVSSFDKDSSSRKNECLAPANLGITARSLRRDRREIDVSLLFAQNALFVSARVINSTRNEVRNEICVYRSAVGDRSLQSYIPAIKFELLEPSTHNPVVLQDPIWTEFVGKKEEFFKARRIC